MINKNNRLLGKWMRILLLVDQPLSVKLFVFSALLILIPMLAVGTISYQRSSEVMEKEAQEYSLQIMEQVKTHVEYYVRDLEIQTLKIMNHPDMNRFLRMRTREEVEQSGIRSEIQQLLQNAAYSRSDITGIAVILDNIQIIDTSGIKSTEPVGDVIEQYWYSAVPMNGELTLISRYVNVMGQQEPVLSVVRRIFSPYTLQPIGMIITDINFKRFQDIADKVTVGRSGMMVILDRQGHYVYHPDVRLLGKQATEEHATTLLDQDSGSLLSEQGSFLTYSHSWFLGWTLVISRPYKDLIHNISYIGRTIFWTTAITLFVAYVLGVLFASSLIRRIRRLQQYMKRVEIGDFSTQIAVESRDEIGLLARGFNAMVGRLKELLDEIYFSKLKETEMSLRQTETELKMLQSQINPHFLYNSLETIRGMALEHDMDHIADMSLAVAKLLRYNLKETAPTVPLRSEIGVCEMYLRIQKYRFEEKLEYRLDVPEWALVQPMVRFSLQPIVENSVVHGIEPNSAKTQITVTAHRLSDTAYCVRVADTGSGIDPERLKDIQSKLQQIDGAPDDSHIGITNVHRRIRHLCGGEYGLSIESRPEGGTTVDIVLPYY
ncbi:cache domain-containing sensor histidine kinase [Paenibacillus hamazuiensis]|uniref:cache domain-containing sensor histidine kinase n=1 Tax=Paenibacillus hamazuiensis TaxID=2936508 RepID=UPI00200E386D|nr:sensor histidine kinase [Paenibacillus hamazuiensis]